MRDNAEYEGKVKDLQQVYDKAILEELGDKETKGQTKPPKREKGGKKKKTVLTGRLYEGGISDEVKKFIAEYGLDRETVTDAEINEITDKIISEKGRKKAVELVENRSIREDVVFSVLVKAAEMIDEEISELKLTDVDQLAELSKEQAAIWNTFEQRAQFFGRGLRMAGILYQTSKIQFNVEKQIADWEARFGEISKEQEEKFREIDKRIQVYQTQLSAAQKKIMELQGQAAMDAIQGSVSRRKSTPKGKYKARAKEVADKLRKLKSKPITLLDADGNPIQITEQSIIPINEIIEAAAKAIELSGDIADGLVMMRQKLEEAEWYKKLSQRDKDAVYSQMEAMLEEIDPDAVGDVESEDGMIKIPKQLIRDLVEEGEIDNIDDLVAAVKEVMIEEYPDATDRQIRDAITGYGRTLEVTEDDIRDQITKMKEIGKLISKIEDARAKRRPLRSGIRRDAYKKNDEKHKQEVRNLERQLRELMKDLPIDQETQERELKTALDAAKTRLNNEIADLDRAIKTGEEIPKKERSVKQDAEIRLLKETRDELKKQYDEKFNTKEKITEQRVKAAVAALERSIDEKERRLESGDIFPEQKEPISTPEIEALRQKRDELQAEIDKQRSKSLKFEEIKEKKALDRIQAQIDSIREKIINKELEAKKNNPLRTVAIDAARQQLNKERQILQKMREEAGLIEKKRLEMAKKRAKSKIAELRRKRETGDFSKKERKAELKADQELKSIKANLLREQEKYAKEFYKEELKQRSAPKQLFDALLDMTQIGRALLTTIEFSPIWIQGGMLTSSYLLSRKPQTVLRALNIARKSFFNEGFLDNWLAELKSSDIYPLIKNTKMSITEPSSRILAAEESSYTGWSNELFRYLTWPLRMAFGKEFHEKIQSQNPLKWFERFGVAYVDVLRLQRFTDAVEVLERQGMTFENNPKEYLGAANVINTMTYRTNLGKLETFAKELSYAFFSPRAFASQVKLTIGLPFFIYNLPPESRKMLARDYGKFLALTSPMIAFAAVYMNNDDDDETEVELDLRSTDALKPKIGNTRLDPWRGLMQWFIFTARLFSDSAYIVFGEEVSEGGYKSPKDEQIYPLGTPYKAPTKAQVVSRTVSNKFAPQVSIIKKHFEAIPQPDGTYETPYGDKYTFEDNLKENLVPMYVSMLRELNEDEASEFLKGLSFFAGLVGWSINTYETKKIPKEAVARNKAIDKGFKEATKDRSFDKVIDSDQSVPNLREMKKNFKEYIRSTDGLITDEEIDSKFNDKIRSWRKEENLRILSEENEAYKDFSTNMKPEQKAAWIAKSFGENWPK